MSFLQLYLGHKVSLILQQINRSTKRNESKYKEIPQTKIYVKIRDFQNNFQNKMKVFVILYPFLRNGKNILSSIWQR